MFITHTRFKIAKGLLGHTPKYDPKAGLRETVAWYHENGFYNELMTISHSRFIYLGILPKNQSVLMEKDNFDCVSQLFELLFITTKCLSNFIETQ